MEARPHPMAFAKRLLPNLAFSSFDRVYAELCGHKREAFLMYLWQQAGQGLAEQVKPVDVGKQPGGAGQAVVKLEVVGALERGGQQIVVVSMPPAIAPNEAVFVALVRGGGQVRVFTLERCRDAAGALSPNETVLAAITPEGRSNFGFLEGDGLETFKVRLGQLLGVPLDGLEQSLPPIDLAAFVAQGASPGASGGRAAPSQPAAWAGAQKVAAVLLPLAGARGVFPVLFRVVPIRVPGIGPLLDLLSLAVVVTLLVWLYRVFDAYRGQTKYSPGMAVGGWFIPLGNLVLPALVVRDAHDTVTKQSGAGLVFGWWLAWLVNTGMMVAWTALVEGLRGGDVASTLSLLSWVTSIAAALNYGLLFVIVKKIDGR